MNLPEVAASRGISTVEWTAITTSLYPGARPESIGMVLDYCRARQLDIFKRPVHIVPMRIKDAATGNEEWRDVIMPGVSELRMTAMRTGECVGIDEPAFGPETTFKGISAPEWARITVYRRVGDERCAFTHVAYYAEECALSNRGQSVNAMWTRRPRGQLAKVAEAGALRKAFPEELGGINTSEELHGKPAGDVVEGEVVEASSATESPGDVACTMGPEGDAYTEDEVLKLAHDASSADDLAFLSDLVNGITDMKTKIRMGRKLAEAAKRVEGVE